ncbi:MAG: endonuclease/exonuclease/phosphatase family protein [Thermodesulfobacteriota bacterium]
MKGITHKIPDHQNVLTSYGKSRLEILPRRLQVLVWNMYKARRPSWAADFQFLTSEKDLILLQEAFLREIMLKTLKKSHALRWHLAAGFTSRISPAEAGVMTGARAEPLDIFYLRSPAEEPLVRLPKMAIGTVYQVEDRPASLLVLNVHAINFVGIPKFKQQMLQLGEIISGHNGPVLLGGDFNTWLSRRSHFLQEMTAALSMDAATFYPDRRSRYLKKAIDHVFVRGIDIVYSTCHYEITGSDHQPIELVLKIQ